MADPNMRCNCGFRRFRKNFAKDSKLVHRWVLFDSGAYGGMGSQPFGTAFGSGSDGVWGLFPGTLNSSVLEITCENCTKVRRADLVSSSSIFGSYVLDNKIYIVAGDVGPVGCFEAQFTNGTDTYSASISVSASPLLPLAAADPGGPTFFSPPTPAAMVVLEATLPEVSTTDTYTISFVDRCSGTTVPLAIVVLEADVTVLDPKSADLGAPLLWLRRIPTKNTIQPATNSIPTIPFEKCDVVAEFDARFGTTPDVQGWTHAGAGVAGDYVLEDGGSLAFTTTVALPSYWKQTVVLGGGAVRSFALHSRFGIETSGAGGAGHGFEMKAGAAAGGAAQLKAVRGNYVSALKYTKTDGSSDTTPLAALNSDLIDGAGNTVSNWHEFAAMSDVTTDAGLAFLDGSSQVFVPSTRFGSDAGTTPASATFYAQFGDVLGDGMTGRLQHFVASAPGRFARAWFRTYTPVTNPTLRLGLVSDLVSGPLNTARFKIYYGSMDTGGNPYRVPASQVSVTATFVTQNQTVELPFSLTGLAAKTPMWFTVERDWAHADDKSRACVHLLHATVRAA